MWPSLNTIYLIRCYPHKTYGISIDVIHMIIHMITSGAPHVPTIESELHSVNYRRVSRTRSVHEAEECQYVHLFNRFSPPYMRSKDIVSLISLVNSIECTSFQVAQRNCEAKTGLLS
jgi:hypothetical protein